MNAPQTLPFSKTRSTSGLVFLAGELPIAADGGLPEGIEAQTALTLDRIAATLPLGGTPAAPLPLPGDQT